MKKQTFFKTLVFTLGLALLFLVGITACQKDGIEAEYALASAAGQTTSKGDSDGEVTSRSVCDCECEYKINSITGYPSSGYHTEMLTVSVTDFCSSCPLTGGYYGSCYQDIWESDPCYYDMGYGLLAVPTRWIPFNCSVDGGQPFTKRFYLTQWDSGCEPGSPIEGQIAYSIRCRGVGTVEWFQNTSNVVNFSGSTNEFSHDVIVDLIEDENNCDCLPDID